MRCGAAAFGRDDGVSLRRRGLRGALPPSAQDDGLLGRGEPEVAEEVGDGAGLDDGGGAEGQVADGADELLELAGDAGAFAGVVAVVGAGGELVDQQAAGFGYK